MKKILFVLIAFTAMASADMTCIQTCDADGRNCLTTCF